MKGLFGSQNQNKLTQLLITAKKNNLAGLKNFIVNDWEPAATNLTDDQGNTALFYAAGHGNIEMVEELLLLPNIDVTLMNAIGFTAADNALLHHQDKICELLFVNSPPSFEQQLIDIGYELTPEEEAQYLGLVTQCIMTNPVKLSSDQIYDRETVIKLGRDGFIFLDPITRDELNSEEEIYRETHWEKLAEIKSFVEEKKWAWRKAQGIKSPIHLFEEKNESNESVADTTCCSRFGF